MERFLLPFKTGAFTSYLKQEYRGNGIEKVSFTFLDWCFYQLFEVFKVCQRVLKHIGSLFISRRHIEIMRCDIYICIQID